MDPSASLPASILTHVLVVEDNLIIAMHLAAMLEDLGASQVDTVATVSDALRDLAAQDFTLAVIDIQLGHENGLVVADRCSADGIPVILSTGFGDALKPAIAAQEVLLQKPYTLRDLEQAVATLAARDRGR